MYAIRAFARLTGLTAKTLRHYERVGLLTPARSPGGYRCYHIRDFARVERILALKSLGLPLKEIGAPLRANADARAALRQRRVALEARRRDLDRAIDALRALEDDADPHAGLERFVAEFAWNRWEERRRALAAPIARAPDRAAASACDFFHALDQALIEQRGDDAAALARQHLTRLDSTTFRAWRSRTRWPAGLVAYVASCYAMEPEAWNRVVTFLEAQRIG